MSTLQRAQLAAPAQLGTTAAALYDNAAATTALFVGVTVFNSDTVARTAKFYLVPASGGALGTAAAANQFWEVTLAAKESQSYELPFGFYLTAQHDSVQGSADAASQVTYFLHGDKIA